MTYRAAALTLAARAGIPIGREVRSVLLDPKAPRRHAAALADDIVEEAARKLPPGDYRHPRYGCTCHRHGAGVGFLATDPGGQQVQIECRWLRGHRTCKHIAEVIAEHLPDDLGDRLAALSAELSDDGYPPTIQPPACGRCGDQIHDGGPCPACGFAGNVSTVRAKEGLDPPGGLNR